MIMKKLLSVMILCLAVAAHAETATVDGIKWTYTVSNGKATVGGGSSSSPAVSTSTTGAITIPSKLGGYPVSSIAYGAFYGCSRLTHIAIPSDVTSIESCAFEDCSGLTSVAIPDSVTSIGYYAFKGCSDSLFDTTTIPGVKLVDGWAIGCTDSLSGNLNLMGVRGIGPSAFYGCSGLTSVMIPDSVTSIGAFAFYGCSGLTSVTIPDSVTSIGDSAFRGCSGLTSVTIPNSVTNIKSYTFYNCSSLTGVTIPDSVTSIGDSAFFGCSGLVEITLPFVGACRGNSGSFDSLFGYIFGVSSYTGGTRTRQYRNSSFSSDYYIPSKLKKVVITDETNLGYGAFYNCSGLTSVTIPDSVTSIGDSAFYNCSGLTSVTIPNSVTSIWHSAFGGCSGLTSVTVSQYVCARSLSSVFSSSYQSITNVVIIDGVTSIGDSAFRGCSELTSVTIPDSVTSIGSSAFYGCEGLTSVAIPDSVTSIGNYAFYGCCRLTSVTIPDSVTSIGSSAFSGCSELTSVTIGNGVTSIGYSAFYGCRRLTSVTIPDSVTSIASYAFRDCSGLTSVTIPDSVMSIGSDAFYNCSRLTSVHITDLAKWCGISFGDTFANPLHYAKNLLLNGSLVEGDLTIPDGVTSIGPSAFSGCGGLTSVTIPSSVTSIGSSAFSDCSGLTSVMIPEGVTSIGDWAFYGCSGLTSVTIPDGVTSIGSYAFENCSGLTSVTIPDGVTSIGSCAFDGCEGLTSVTIPDSVTSIGSSAFRGCGGLSCIYVSPGDGERIKELMSNSGVSAYVQEVVWVAFVANGGSVNESRRMLLLGSSIGEIPAPIRTGHTFMGWWTEENGGMQISALTILIENVTCYAHWTINTHTVTFDANGGVGGWGEVRDYGSAIAAPTVTRTGYTFKGWDKEVASTVPDEDLTYVAQWEINKYNVMFDANGGVGGWSEARDYDSAIIAPAVSRVGYTFTGWSPTVPATVPAKDATYTAQWQINTHTVTFDANGGSGGWSAVRNYGTSITAPTVTRTGYTFKGWLPEVAATVPDEDVSYTAQWEANTYTVSFNPNGGNLNGGATSKGVVFDSAYGELPIPVLEFCTFDGWMLGGAVVVASTKVTTAANHTLAAQWSRWGVRVAPDAALTGRTLRELYPDDYANLTTVVLEEGVTELPDGFFAGCDNVENLTLPESLETLGYGDLPTKIRASLDYGTDGFMVFQGWVLGYRDDGASALTLPQGAKGIGTRAFAEFWDLETVVIPDTVKRIGRCAFYECTFLDDVEIPDSVETIGIGAFENCSYMQTLSVGTSVRKVADRAFARCASLQSVAFTDGLASIGECAFSNDWRMLSVSLPHSVTNIGDGAFAACMRVKGVAVPANVMTLADMFPAAYTIVESAVVAAGETDIMDDMFNGCEALVDFIWSGSETNVGERAFFGCEALEAVAMPDSVERIGAEAFKKCSSLRDLTLSRSLAALPDYAFAQCGSLDSFIVPASVVSLGECIVEDSAVSAIYYLGNAPEYDSNAYADAAAGLVTYVVRGTRGWDGTPSSRVLPEDWIGHEITYWTPNRFDVTFDANGGYFGVSSFTQWAEQQITDMGYALPNQNPVRPGYAFEGWWTEPTAGAQVKYSTQVTATKPHSLYAHWRLLGNLVTATFNANGGTVVIPGSQSYVAGQTFGEFPVPSRRGYAFCGWWTESVGGDRITEASRVPTADIELFAHWEPIRYFVAYDANGGTGAMTNQVHVYDAPKSLDENLFSRTGYAFSGWARSGDGQVEYADRAVVVNLAEVSNAIVKLYAVWSGAGYNVRFDSNGGTGVMENQTIQIGETQNLHTNAFAFSGREFLGWATEPGGTVAYRDGAAVRGLASANGATVHLYAVWRTSDATWRVSFYGNGGSVAPGHWNVARGETLDALPTPTRPGHAFMGWWTRSAGGASVTPPFAVTCDMSLYAHWRAYDDPLPPVSGDAGVAAVMGDSADLRLAENIKTVEEYDALVEWADANGIGHQAVRTSLHVWAAYALGAERLFVNEPSVSFEEVAVAAGKTLPGDGMVKMTVAVTVKDGADAVAVDAEKVAEMFEATRDLGDWNGAAKLTLTVTVRRDDGDTPRQMKFDVSIDAAANGRAFIRVRKLAGTVPAS